MLEPLAYLAIAGILSFIDERSDAASPEVRSMIGQWIRRADRRFLLHLAKERRHFTSLILPFLSCWFYILFALKICAISNFLAPLSLLIVASRLRALQEVSHFAVHRALYDDKATSYAVADLLFHYPVIRPRSSDRFASHVEQHHRFSNTPRDPNVTELINSGLGEGMTRRRFWQVFFWPLTWRGVLALIRHKGALMFPLSAQNPPGIALAARWGTFLVSALLIWLVGGWVGLLGVYLVAILLLYPQFAWISQLIEHRWLSPIEVDPDVSREYAHGRPTDFPGLSGALLRILVLPYGDSYHLAHSLFPFVRWNYLPAVDAAMKDLEPNYARGRSIGLFTARNGVPAAIDVIRDKVIGRAPAAS